MKLPSMFGFLFIFCSVFLNFALRFGYFYWNSLVNPTSIRLIDNGTLQYESFVMHRQILLFSLSSLPMGYLEYFGNTEYRAILISYFVSFLLILNHNIYISVMFIDFLFWLLGAISLYIISKYITGSSSISYISALIMTFSPLGIAWIGTSDARTAQFMIFPSFILLIIYVYVRNYAYSFFHYGLILFALSLSYSYHYVIMGTCIAYGFVFYRNRAYFISIINLFICYFLIYQLFLFIISLFGLNIHYNLNDPKNYMTKFILTDYFVIDPAIIFTFLFTKFWAIVDIFLYAFDCYSTPIFTFCIIGIIYSSGFFRRIFVSSFFVTLFLSLIYGPAWVIMSNYPCVYISAAIGVHGLAKSANLIFRIRQIYIFYFVIIFLLFSWATINQDLWGSADFVRAWWGNAWVVQM